MNKIGDKLMINKNDNNKYSINQELRFNESIRRIIPNAKFICINFYEDSLVKKDLGNNENLRNCDIVEIVTPISVNTKTFKSLIKKAGYRLFDVIYETNEFHFFVRKVGESET